MRVSVVACALDEEATIGALVDAVCADDVAPHELIEVLVYDDGSTDGTSAVVDAHASRDARIRLIRGSARRGRAASCETLFAAARGEAIIKFDADIIPEPGSIKAMADAIDGGAAMAFGACEPVRRRRNAVSAGAAFASTLVKTLQRGSRGADYAVGRIFALRNDGTRPRIPHDVINEDHYLSLHVRRSGGDVAFAAGARCRFVVPDTLLDYRNQSARIRHGERQLERSFGAAPMRAGDLVPVICANAVRDPIGAACWAAIYATTLVMPDRWTPADEPRITSTKSAPG